MLYGKFEGLEEPYTTTFLGGHFDGHIDTVQARVLVYVKDQGESKVGDREPTVRAVEMLDKPTRLFHLYRRTGWDLEHKSIEFTYHSTRPADHRDPV